MAFTTLVNLFLHLIDANFKLLNVIGRQSDIVQFAFSEVLASTFSNYTIHCVA